MMAIKYDHTFPILPNINRLKNYPMILIPFHQTSKSINGGTITITRPSLISLYRSFFWDLDLTTFLDYYVWNEYKIKEPKHHGRDLQGHYHTSYLRYIYSSSTLFCLYIIHVINSFSLMEHGLYSIYIHFYLI